jgi:aspartate-semialdehyde dehydrogenase
MRIPVAVLGATGTVGERLLALLAGHPWFRVVEVAASDRSVGATVGDRIEGGSGLPRELARLRLRSLDGPFDAPLVLSALPSEVAREVEPRLAAGGHLVVSNASAFRDHPRVPLVVPEVNPEHLSLLDGQVGVWGEAASGDARPGGGIVTNPNCAVAGLVVALAPLHRAFGLESVVVTTLQAISGAGRPGPGAATVVDNILPWIGGEEEKVEAEPQRILGALVDGEVRGAPFSVGATCTRVPVLHGHTAAVSVTLAVEAGPEEVRRELEGARSRLEGTPLPSAPPRPLEVLLGDDRPQPRLDRNRGAGMTVSVGRIRRCPVHDVSFLVLSHNLVRGAAGAALLNGELAVTRGRVPGVAGPPGAE